MAKRFVFNITDAQHAKLEWYRATRGLRSMADALRSLIDGVTPTGTETMMLSAVMERARAAKPPLNTFKTPEDSGYRGVLDVQLGPVKPKPGERLKKK